MENSFFYAVNKRNLFLKDIIWSANCHSKLHKKHSTNDAMSIEIKFGKIFLGKSLQPPVSSAGLNTLAVNFVGVMFCQVKCFVA